MVLVLMTNESNLRNNLFDLLFNYIMGRSAQALDGETNGERSRRVEIKGVVRSSTSKQDKEKIDERQLMILDNRSVRVAVFSQLVCCPSSRA